MQTKIKVRRKAALDREKKEYVATDLGVLDHPLAMVVVNYLYGNGGRDEVNRIRGYCRIVLGNLGWPRSAVDAEYRVQMKRLLAIGYIVRPDDDDTGDIVELSVIGRNGALTGVLTTSSRRIIREGA